MTGTEVRQRQGVDDRGLVVVSVQYLLETNGLDSFHAEFTIAKDIVGRYFAMGCQRLDVVQPL